VAACTRYALIAGLAGGFLLGSVSGGALAHAQPLNHRIPGLFGGSLTTSIASGTSEGQPLRFSDQFRNLSAALAAARSQAPIPSAGGSFRFAWDPEVHTFVRSEQSLGPIFGERAQTLGRNTGTVGLAYTHIDFDTLEGKPLDNLSFSQAAFSPGFLRTDSDKTNFRDDVLKTHLDLALSFDLFFLTAAYGITDSIDASVTLSLAQARMKGAAVVMVENPGGNLGGTILAKDTQLTDAKGNRQPGHLCEAKNFQCATDGFSSSAFGTGDLFLRTKWHLYDVSFADFAVAGVLTLPTGNADDFLGFHNPTFTPWLIASKTLGRISPHLNLGYAIRGGDDGASQAEWIVGADLRALEWLTLASDFLGFHDDNRDGNNDDVLQSAVGFRVNPFGDLVIAAAFQFPLNRDGLRADVIYTGQVEYTY
jgi:hypothetical protein